MDRYVPAAGLRWLVVARLREIHDTVWLREALLPLFPAERLDAYAAATGLDLRESEEALAAGFDYGTLYLARTRSNERVESLFEDRMIAGAIERRPHPDLRVFAGMIQETPAAMVSQRGYLVGVAFGDPRLARIAEAYARNRLKSATALEGVALSTLPTSLQEAPVRFYAPGPFGGEWSAGARGLLGVATAVGVSVGPLPTEKIRVVVVVSGEWSQVGAEARARVERVWDELAESAMGRLMGLDHPATPPIITVTPEDIRLSVDLALEPLVNGLHAAVSADVWQMLELPRPSSWESDPAE